MELTVQQRAVAAFLKTRSPGLLHPDLVADKMEYLVKNLVVWKDAAGDNSLILKDFERNRLTYAERRAAERHAEELEMKREARLEEKQRALEKQLLAETHAKRREEAAREERFQAKVKLEKEMRLEAEAKQKADEAAARKQRAAAEEARQARIVAKMEARRKREVDMVKRITKDREVEQMRKELATQQRERETEARTRQKRDKEAANLVLERKRQAAISKIAQREPLVRLSLKGERGQRVEEFVTESDYVTRLQEQKKLAEIKQEEADRRKEELRVRRTQQKALEAEKRHEKVEERFRLEERRLEKVAEKARKRAVIEAERWSKLRANMDEDDRAVLDQRARELRAKQEASRVSQAELQRVCEVQEALEERRARAEMERAMRRAAKEQEYVKKVQAAKEEIVLDGERRRVEREQRVASGRAAKVDAQKRRALQSLQEEEKATTREQNILLKEMRREDRDAERIRELQANRSRSNMRKLKLRDETRAKYELDKHLETQRSSEVKALDAKRNSKIEAKNAARAKRVHDQVAATDAGGKDAGEAKSGKQWVATGSGAQQTGERSYGPRHSLGAEEKATVTRQIEAFMAKYAMTPTSYMLALIKQHMPSPEQRNLLESLVNAEEKLKHIDWVLNPARNAMPPERMLTAEVLTTNDLAWLCGYIDFLELSGVPTDAITLYASIKDGAEGEWILSFATDVANTLIRRLPPSGHLVLGARESTVKSRYLQQRRGPYRVGEKHVGNAQSCILLRHDLPAMGAVDRQPVLDGLAADTATPDEQALYILQARLEDELLEFLQPRALLFCKYFTAHDAAWRLRTPILEQGVPGFSLPGNFARLIVSTGECLADDFNDLRQRGIRLFVTGPGSLKIADRSHRKIEALAKAATEVDAAEDEDELLPPPPPIVAPAAAGKAADDGGDASDASDDDAASDNGQGTREYAEL